MVSALRGQKAGPEGRSRRTEDFMSPSTLNHSCLVEVVKATHRCGERWMFEANGELEKHLQACTRKGLKSPESMGRSRVCCAL